MLTHCIPATARYCDNKNDISWQGTISLENFPGHLATDLLMLIAVAREEPIGDDGDDTSINYNKMSG